VIPVIKKLLGPGFGLLEERDFRNLWGGNLFSNTGTFMMIIAAGWEMSSLTQSAALSQWCRRRSVCPLS
jgi:hypothetical protein